MFSSLALDEIRDPDFADMSIGVLPAHATADPAAWARSLFARHSLPTWFRAFVTVTRAAPFTIREVVDNQALVAFDGQRIDFRAAVAVNEASALVHIVTSVRLKGALGRMPLAPMRIVQYVVIRSLLKRSQRRLSGVTIVTRRPPARLRRQPRGIPRAGS